MSTAGAGHVFVKETDVRFRDLDALNHLNSSVYFSLMEHARVQLFLEKAGVADAASLPFILASARIEYRRAVGASTRLRIEVWVSRIGGKSWDLDYRILEAGGALCAEGRTVQVAYDYKAGRSVALDANVKAFLEAYRGPPLSLGSG